MGLGKSEMFGVFLCFFYPSSFLSFLFSFSLPFLWKKKRGGGGSTLILSFHCFLKKALTPCSGDTVITDQIPHWPHEL